MAGWARLEYAIFPLFWATVLALFIRTRDRRVQVPWAAFWAMVPTLIILGTGGATHLGWIIRYNLSGSASGFHAQRGQPIEWALVHQRLSELWRLQLASSDPGAVVASYGVGVIVTVIGLLFLLVPDWRRRYLHSDPSGLSVFFLLSCGFLLYAQSARFSSTYGEIGIPIFWTAGALLWRRMSGRALASIMVFVAYPLLPSIAPGSIHAAWDARPAAPTPPVPGLGRIPVANDNGAPSMRELVRLWHRLGLNGRATVSVARRNDIAWGNDAIVGFLIDAPAAAWPLTYDPGLVNQPEVEREAARQLCRDRAPVVQLAGAYPNPSANPAWIGSRYLDEFLALNYHVRAVAGFYRILLPDGPGCIFPQQASAAHLMTLRDSFIRQNELPEAGALSVVLMDHAAATGAPVDPVDAAIAALGGYTLVGREIPTVPGAPDARLLEGTATPQQLASAAAVRWPSDYEALAVQTSWISHRIPGQPGEVAAAQAVLALGLRHADWPQAIENMTSVIPPNAELFRVLSRRGASGPVFDRWRYSGYAAEKNERGAIASGFSLIADYKRADDPLDVAQTESLLSSLPGLLTSCARTLTSFAAINQGLPVPRAAPDGCLAYGVSDRSL